MSHNCDANDCPSNGHNIDTDWVNALEAERDKLIDEKEALRESLHQMDEINAKLKAEVEETKATLKEQERENEFLLDQKISGDKLVWTLIETRIERDKLRAAAMGMAAALEKHLIYYETYHEKSGAFRRIPKENDALFQTATKALAAYEAALRETEER